MKVSVRLLCLFAVSAILVPASAAPKTPLAKERGGDVSRRGTAQMMLLPVGGTGNEITIEPGERFVIEVFVADIAPTRLRGFQTQLPVTASGGAVGSVDFVPISGESPRINQFRFDDWVFARIAVGASTSVDPPRIAAATNAANESVLVTEAKYCGEFTFEASADAIGDFTIDIVLLPLTSQLADPDSQDIPFTAISAIIHISCTENADCDDGLFCTGVETCSGICQPGSSPCTDPDFPFCDEFNDECDECEVDQDCDDSVFCNGAETCPDGVCQPAADLDAGTPCGDGSDTTCTDPDTCDGAGACQDNHASNDTACDDGLFCNENETCTGGGVCGGGSFTCDDDNTCTIDTCDEQQDECSNDVDPISCLIEGQCVANGVLNPLNSCEVCDSAQAPDSWTVLPDGSACEDDSVICTADLCTAGACTHDDLTEGTECDVDGEPCNGVDTCDGMGTCLPGSITDCNENGLEDDCDLDDGTSLDCNENQVPDECDIAQGTSDDCNENGTPDECEPDCNENSIADECDIAQGTSDDCNQNGVPDDCEPDCNENTVADECDIADQTSSDCNNNSIPDECDIADQTSPDCNDNLVPDECDMADCAVDDLSCGDCQPNGIPDGCDIADGTSLDVNPTNGLPDECEACESNQACDDGDECTFDICVDDVCQNIEARYGDIATKGAICGPDGRVTLTDILIVLDGFAGFFLPGCEKFNIDIAGDQGSCEPNGQIDLRDILAVLDAFAGRSKCCSGG